MLIPQELLAEKNYAGTRLIEITDPKVLELKSKLKDLQKEAEPFLLESEKFTPEMDIVYGKIRDIKAKMLPFETEIKALHAEITPVRQKYDEQIAFVEAIDQRATLIKNKMQPLINKIVDKELSEFEKPMQIIEKEGKIFVEISDEIEEKVKAVRAMKLKNK